MLLFNLVRSISLSFPSVNDKQPWIVDSRAFDHLIGLSYNFVTYFPCAGNEKIIVADGS